MLIEFDLLLADKSVAGSDHGFDQGLLGLSNKFTSECSHRHSHGVRKWVHSLVPNMFQESFLTQNLTNMDHEVAKKGEFLGGEVKGPTVPFGYETCRVQMKQSNTHCCILTGCLSTKQASNTGGKLGQSERLDQIVVRSIIQPGYSLCHTVACRDHQNPGTWVKASIGSDQSANLSTIDIGQGEIKGNQVIFVEHETIKRCLPIDGDIYRIPFPSESSRNCGSKFLFIINNQNAHTRTVARDGPGKLSQDRRPTVTDNSLTSNNSLLGDADTVTSDNTASSGNAAGNSDDAQPLPTPAEAAVELEQALFEIKRVIVGQDHMVERLFVALLSRGHILLEGLPGVAKTLAVSTLAQVIGGGFVRLQFTPDLLPSDLIGTRIWRASSESFDIEWGPVFTNLLLTDEINRAPAKVQSALLEVMAERQVSIAGQTKALPAPFLVLATQNPIESEGVYTLPEAQRDRFLMKVSVDYPTPSEELEIVRRMGTNPPDANQVLTLARLEQLQEVCDGIYVDAGVAQYAVDLVMATREPLARGLPELDPLIEFGVSPRATLGLVAAGRALALLRGRNYVTPQDLFDVARDVLRHRLMLSYEALAKSLDADDVLNRLLSVIPAAAVSPRDVSSGTFAATLPGPSPAGYPNPTPPGSGMPAPPPAQALGSLPAPIPTSVMPLPPPVATPVNNVADPTLGLPPIPAPPQPGLAHSAPPLPDQNPGATNPGIDGFDGTNETNEAD